jgi:hypothetical protein
MRAVGLERTDSRTSPDLSEYLEELEDTFRRAASDSGGATERYITVGDRTVHLAFAGATLPGRLLPALEHLVVGETPSPDLRLRIWDSRSTGCRMPPPAWGHDQYLTGGRIRGVDESRMFVRYQMGMDSLHMLDLRTQRGVFWVRDGTRVPWWESASPLRLLINRWADERQLLVLHAAAVGNETAGILLAGSAGSGKSTTALSCMLHGLSHGGDDSVVVGWRPTPTVYSLYNTAKLCRDSLERLSSLETEVSGVGAEESDKAVCFLKERFSRRLFLRRPLRAILFPVVTGGGTTRIEPLSPARCLQALAPSSILQIPGGSGGKLRLIAELARSVPAHSLHLGTDPKQVAEAVASFIGRLA